MTPDARQKPAGGTVIAFDFGLRRIGVAVGECEPATASALTTITARDGEPDWPALDRLIDEWQPQLLVAGIPHHADGSESDMATAVRAFAGAISSRYNRPVSLVDESLSSRAAREELRGQRRDGTRRRRVRPGDTDAIAARLILETWLAGSL